MKRFALTGVGGYIAPRHLKAIKDSGNDLVAACDPNDSVGVMDSYFFNARFFKEFERFDRHLEKLRRRSEGIDYLSICSPNFLHDAHIRLALRLGADAICEKPLVLNPWNIDALMELSQEYKRNIYTVLQLRSHPALVNLKEKIDSDTPTDKYEIDLSYITSRGRWYLVSWKGNVEQSGGVSTNIGIHFFDMLMWIFGKPESFEVHINEQTRAAGYIELEKARVRWYLSINNEDLPLEWRLQNKTTYRSITVDGQEIEFSGGFTDLHTVVYKNILQGNGHSPLDAYESIALAHAIRTAHPSGINKRSHYLLNDEKCHTTLRTNQHI